MDQVYSKKALLQPYQARWIIGHLTCKALQLTVLPRFAFRLVPSTFTIPSQLRGMAPIHPDVPVPLALASHTGLQCRRHGRACMHNQLCGAPGHV